MAEEISENVMLTATGSFSNVELHGAHHR
jgi:hypothetical protein